VSRYQKDKTNLDFTEATDSEWQCISWAICKSAPRSRQMTTPAPHHSVFLQAGCPSCRPTNSVKALKCCLYICTANTRLYRQWRQRECNCAGHAKGIRKQLQGRKRVLYLLGDNVGAIESIMSPCEVCAKPAELGLHENSHRSDDNFG